MATKTLLSKKNQVSTSLFDTKNTMEIDDFLKNALSDLLSRKQQALLLNMGTPAEGNLSLFNDSKRPVRMGLLVIPISELLPKVKIENVLDDLFSMGVYTPLKNLSRVTNILTGREHEVLQLLTAGKSYKSIAHCLSISLATVKFHMKNLYIKLNVGNREDAVEWARQNL